MARLEAPTTLTIDYIVQVFFENCNDINTWHFDSYEKAVNRYNKTCNDKEVYTILSQDTIINREGVEGFIRTTLAKSK